MMTEGQEKDEFWNILGGKGQYSNSPRLQVPLGLDYLLNRKTYICNG